MIKPVAVIIVNWNGKQYLNRCLSAVLAQTYPRVEIILVDNGSTDGSVDFVREHFPTVKIIPSLTNVGFAAGNNLGIRATDTAYVATLNNDTEVDPNWLSELVRAMESDPRIGMCASKMLFFDDRTLIDSAGVSMDAAGVAWDRQGGERDHDQQSAPVEVFGACAGAALYRRSMLDQIALPPPSQDGQPQFFDEDFFIYLEDVDLAWRAQLAGWRCLYVPTARVLHVHSATMQEGSPFKNYLLGRNRLWTLIKNYPTSQLLRALPAILFYDLSASFYALLVRGDTSPGQGRLAGLRGMPAMLAKRAYVQQHWSHNRSWTVRLTPLENPWKILQRYGYLRRLRRPPSNEVLKSAR